MFFLADPDREAQAADAPARGRQGAEGEPGPARAAGVGYHGGPPGRREPGRLPPLREDEVSPHHRAAQAGGQDQAGRGAAQVPAGQSAAGAKATALRRLEEASCSVLIYLFRCEIVREVAGHGATGKESLW